MQWEGRNLLLRNRGYAPLLTPKNPTACPLTRGTRIRGHTGPRRVEKGHSGLHRLEQVAGGHREVVGKNGRSWGSEAITRGRRGDGKADGATGKHGGEAQRLRDHKASMGRQEGHRSHGKDVGEIGKTREKEENALGQIICHKPPVNQQNTVNW
eukprot:Gb_36912 [translate_table: standard]